MKVVMKKVRQKDCKGQAARKNAAGETLQEERQRQEAFDRWLSTQPVRSSRYLAMADYGSLRRPLTW